MRVALTTMAATSGVLLLGIGLYGHPAAYLQEARDGWSNLTQAASTELPHDLDREVLAVRMNELAQKVANLKARLQTPPADPQAVPPPVPAAPNPAAPDPIAPNIAAPVPGAPSPKPPGLEASGPVAPVPETSGPLEPSPEASAPAAGVPRGPVAASVPDSPQMAAPVPPSATILPDVPAPRTTTENARPQTPPPQMTVPQTKAPAAKAPRVATAIPQSAPEPQPIEIPERHPPQMAEPVPPPRNAIPARPPLPQVVQPPAPSPPGRVAADDSQSVLTRLRQGAPPANAPVQDQQPVLSPSPSLPKLLAARHALGNGQIEEARRLMQEAQLQLVFRPMNAGGEDYSLGGRGAADVAHALEALSTNDVARTLRYLDVAVGDVSGIETKTFVQEPGPRATGYAPAYPPR